MDFTREPGCLIFGVEVSSKPGEGGLEIGNISRLGRPRFPYIFRACFNSFTRNGLLQFSELSEEKLGGFCSLRCLIF